MENKNKKNLNIQILADKNSWIVPYARELKKVLNSKKHKTELINSENKIKKGNILVILGWGKIINKNSLNLHQHNLVVHESTLPKGKGWSPLTWQILEGKNKIPITLFEATEKVDSGLIYFQDIIKFKGHELIDELRKEQGGKTIELVMKFVDNYPNIVGKEQKGKETFYPRRRPKDSEIDIHKPIIQLFNKFRVADNERYSIFFKYKGHKYILKIYKKNEKRK